MGSEIGRIIHLWAAAAVAHPRTMEEGTEAELRAAHLAIRALTAAREMVR